MVIDSLGDEVQPSSHRTRARCGGPVSWRPSTPGQRAMLGAGSLLVAGSLAFGVLSPPEHCPAVTSASLLQAASETVDWFARNQNADGTWLYQYRAETDTVVDDYNVVRHAGAVMGLYMAAGYGIEEALPLAERGLEWSRDGLIRGDGLGCGGHGAGDPSTGGTALLLAGLADRREQTGDTRDDELMVELAQFLVTQTEPSGAVLASYDMATGAPVAGVYSKYYTGEAYWALAPDGAAVPGWAVGRGRRSRRCVLGDATRRRRRSLAAAARSLGGLRARRYSGLRGCQPRPLAHRGRAGVRAAPGGAVRGGGALGRPAGRSVGTDGPRPAGATRGWLRRHRRRADGAVAGGRGRAADGRHARCDRRPGDVHRRHRDRRADRCRRGGCVRSAQIGCRAPGSSRARRAWTTSSTCSPPWSARCRSRTPPGNGRGRSPG